MKHVTEKKGYITLEAAIFLPVFILAVMSLAYYINIYSVNENVSNTIFDETARLASKAAVVRTAPGYKQVLNERLKAENTVIEDLDVSKFKFLYWNNGLNDMISIDVEYSMNLNLPLDFGHGYTGVSKVKCRGFTGIRVEENVMTFDELENEGSWEPVWIFPMSGQRYHDENCSFVKGNAKEMVLTVDLKKKYSSCRLCESDSASLGSIVYCFTETGTAYHLDICKQVDRYTMEINKDDAINKGYTPCSKCGGG